MILSQDSRWAATVWTIWVVRLQAWGRYPCWAGRGWSSQARTCNYMLGSLNIDIDTGTLLGNEGTWGWWRPPPGGRGRSSQPPPSPPSPSCPLPPSGLPAPPRPGDNVILYYHSLNMILISPATARTEWDLSVWRGQALGWWRTPEPALLML